MKIHIVDDYEGMSAEAARIVADQLNRKKETVLGLATGSTVEGLYRELVKMNDKGLIGFENVTTFNLDEYIGLGPEHPQSYHYYMHRHLFGHVGIPAGRINIPAGLEEDSERTCRDYELAIKAAGGIDLQILGIGVNGHIGFNEPAGELKAETHLVDLSAETIKANSRFFESMDDVPRRAITMGVGSIMHARTIMLLASGENKAGAIKQTVDGPITTAVPASLLQLHGECILVLDREAASLL
ncbi:MAG: glucosamine-6-phosphate deaminase [Firmicutes bacterium]|nr:glucosamine-6-phosphate deaminase [Bacillota bacterium]